MLDFSNCSSSVVWPEIYHFSPLSFSSPNVCGRSSVLPRLRKKKLLLLSTLTPLPPRVGDFSSHPSTAPYSVPQKLPPTKLVCGIFPANILLIPLGCPPFGTWGLSLTLNISSPGEEFPFTMHLSRAWHCPWLTHVFRTHVKSNGIKTFAPGQRSLMQLLC